MPTRILMPTRKQITLSAIIVLTLAVGVFAQKKDDKKQTDEQKRDIQAVVKLVDDMAAGQPAPNDFNVTWAHEDFLKAQGNKQYAPFAVTLTGTVVSATADQLAVKVATSQAWPSHLTLTKVNRTITLAVPAPALACMWDHDTLRQERARFPHALELITGKFLRHSKEAYEWRIRDRANLPGLVAAGDFTDAEKRGRVGAKTCRADAVAEIRRNEIDE